MSALIPHSSDRRLRLLQDIALRLSAEMSLRQILTGIAATLRDSFDWDYVGCASVDAAEGYIRHEAHVCSAHSELPLGLLQPIGAGVMGEVARTASVRRVDDVELDPHYIALVPGTRSEICAPVLHQGEVIAVLDAQSRYPGAFSEQDVETLQLVAEMLGGTLAASRQLEAARQRAEVIGMLAEASRAMLAEDHLDGMLQRLIDELHRCFQLTLCTLCLVNEDDGHLELRAFAGQSRYPLVRGAAWRPHVGVTGRALRTGKRIHVPDVSSDSDYIEGNPDSRAELVVPVRYRDHLLGLINLESRSPSSFSPSNQLAMQALADQAAGAIRLAMTKQRLQETSDSAARAAAELEQSNRRLERANQRLREMSLRDPLTGLGNRRRLDRGLSEAWNEARRKGTPLAVLLMDIDHYKAYNDLYGHGAGDVCLRRVGRALRQSTAVRGAIVARYGGEEFALVLPGADVARARQVAERIQQLLTEMAIPHAGSPTAGQVTLSIGVACEVPHPLRVASDMLQRADAALYAAKGSGRNRVVVAPPCTLTSCSSNAA